MTYRDYRNKSGISYEDTLPFSDLYKFYKFIPKCEVLILRINAYFVWIKQQAER